MLRSPRSLRPFVPLATALVALAVSGCADEQPLRPEPAAPSLARGPNGGFPTVLLGKGNGPNSASTLQEAVGKVAAGGTIRVFAGTHDASGTVIDKPLSVVATGSGTPVLRIVGAADSDAPAGIEVVDAAGTVAFRDLVIDNTGAPGSIAVAASGTERVEFEDVAFEIVQDGGGVHLSGTGAGETLEVSGGTVRGGSIALWADAARASVEGTSFAGQDGVAVYGGRASSLSVVGADFAGCGEYCILGAGIANPQGVVTYGALTVRDVDAVDCGTYSCVYAVNGVDVSITGSRFSNTVVSPVDGLERNVIFLWLSRGEISDNVIDGCGLGQCIAVSRDSDADIVGNRITAYGDQGTRNGIVVSHGFRYPVRPSTARVRDNVVTGIGSNPENREGHAVGCLGEWCGLITVEGGSSAELEGNTLSNGNIGIFAREGGQVTGRDNRVSDVGRGIAILDEGSAATLRFNDVTGASILDLEQSHGEASDLTCNWWGSAEGPDDVASAEGPSLYSPWASAPIAGAGATACAGS
jgi:hypothetical protein